MKKLQVSLCFFACFTTGVWAENETVVKKRNQFEQSLTLPMAVEMTLQNNPQFYQYGYTRKRLMAERANSDLSPGYELNMDVENFAGSGNNSDFESAEITVALSSVIELGDKRQFRVSVTEARLSQMEFERQAKTLDVLGDMTSAFIRLLTTQQEQQLAAEAVKLSKALYKTVQQRAKRGATSDAEVLRARAMLTQEQIRQKNLSRKLARQEISLVRYWGQTEVTFSSLKGDLFAFGQAQRFEDLYNKLKNSPAIEILASESRLKDAEIRLAQTQNTADVGWQFGVRQFQETDDTALVLGVSIPLFSESRNQSGISSAPTRIT